MVNFWPTCMSVFRSQNSYSKISQSEQCFLVWVTDNLFICKSTKFLLKRFCDYLYVEFWFSNILLFLFSLSINKINTIFFCLNIYNCESSNMEKNQLLFYLFLSKLRQKITIVNDGICRKLKPWSSTQYPDMIENVLLKTCYFSIYSHLYLV
jgi:hypothetical protein